MFDSLPKNPLEFCSWPWEKIQPYFTELAGRPLDTDTVAAWLEDWSHLAELLAEAYARLWVATTVNTDDQLAAERFEWHLAEIYPRAEAASQVLKEKLLSSGLEPDGFEIPLRNLRQQANLYRESNLELLSRELELKTEYDKIIGAQGVSWEGQEVTLLQLQAVFMEPNRELRQQAWRLFSQRWLEDRQKINDLWGELLTVRRQQAQNAGEPDYRAYRWKQMLRFDYTPQDCFSFHQAIEEVVVPVIERFNEKRRRQLGVDRLRPWDLDVEPGGLPPLKPFETVERLESGVADMFARVDPQLAAHYETMRREKLLDLENRKGKGPGGYCTEFFASRQPFIFMNAIGIHDDVLTLLHEGGHAFHAFEASRLPYMQLREVGNEIAEVASMSMEFLGSPYLTLEQGGFYSRQDAARARIEHLEAGLRFLPYMAVVDAFQHWVYTHAEAAAQPAECDRQWTALWERFMPGVDWSGFEEELATGWHRKAHIHEDPFYYIEYGMAQLGAMQVWRNSLADPVEAVAAYRRMLALGNSRPLPELFAAAGAKFAFDAATLRELVSLAEQTIEALEPETLNG